MYFNSASLSCINKFFSSNCNCNTGMYLWRRSFQIDMSKENVKLDEVKMMSSTGTFKLIFVLWTDFLKNYLGMTISMDTLFCWNVKKFWMVSLVLLWSASIFGFTTHHPVSSFTTSVMLRMTQWLALTATTFAIFFDPLMFT